MHTTQGFQQRAAFYIRVSTEDQAEKYGIDLQKAALDAIVKSKGKLDDGSDAMVLAGENHIYIDEGISGTIDLEERPAFSKLLEDIERPEKPFDVIIVYKIDRFARRLKILLDAVDYFEENNIQFISANESIDTTSPFGKAILGILGVIAELEIETTKQRTQDGRRQAISKGVFMGQIAPFGYQKNIDKRLEPFEAEAKIVRDIFSWFVYENLTPQQIADQLTRDEVMSPDTSAIHYGKRKGSSKKRNNPFFWRAEVVKDILENEVYLGLYYYGKSATDKKSKKVMEVAREDWKLSEYRHTPLIEPLEFEKAQKLLRDLAKRVHLANKQKNTHLYLLSGLIKCIQCSHEMPDEEMMTWIGDRKILDVQAKTYSYYYKCGRKNKKKYSKTCTVLPLPADQLEEYVLNFLIELVRDPKYVYNYHQNLKSTKNQSRHLKSRRDQLRKRMNGIPVVIENLKVQHANGIIKTVLELKEKINEQENKKNQYQEEIDKLNQQLGSQAVSNGYLRVLEGFKDKYATTLKDVKSDREEAYKFIHSLISRIAVSSRMVTPLDSVAGRKTGKQFIPISIEIILKLPQEILIDLVDSKFGVGNSNL